MGRPLTAIAVILYMSPRVRMFTNVNRYRRTRRGGKADVVQIINRKFGVSLTTYSSSKRQL